MCKKNKIKSIKLNGLVFYEVLDKQTKRPLKLLTCSVWLSCLAVVSGIACAIYFPVTNYINDQIATVTFDFSNVSRERIYNDNWESDLKNNLVINVTKNNKTTFQPKFSEITISDINKNVGIQTVTFDYCGWKDSIELTTKAASIATPQISIEKNLISWPQVEHSASYTLFYGSNEKELINSISQIKETTFDVKNIDYEGDIYFGVQAKKENTNYTDSSLSNIIRSRKIKSISDISYSDGVFTWNSVGNADGYNVQINDSTFKTDTNSIAYLLGADKTTITISALSNQQEIIDSKPFSKVFTKIGEFSNFRVNENVLYWDEVKYATNYYVYIDLLLRSVSPNAYHALDLYSRGIHRVDIVAVGKDDSFIKTDSGRLYVVIGFELSINNKTLEWTDLSFEDGYDIFIDDKYYKTVNSTSFDLSSCDDIDVGRHTVNVKTHNISGLGDTTNTVEITKLAAPTLSVENETLITTNPFNTLYYDNNVLFDGDLSKLSVGEHSIHAINTSSSDNVLNSNPSNTILLTKLSAPQISLASTHDKIDIKDSHNTILYADGIIFDGNLDSLTSGNHVICAMNKGISNNELSSDVSNNLSLNKLIMPTISFDGEKLNKNNSTSGFSYILNNSLFDGDLSSLSNGDHIISSRNFGVLDNEVNSNVSNELLIKKINVTFQKISANYYQAIWKATGDTTIDIDIKYFKDGLLVDSVSMFDLPASTNFYNLSFSRHPESGDVVADSCTIQVFPQGEEFNVYYIFGKCSNL